MLLSSKLGGIAVIKKCYEMEINYMEQRNFDSEGIVISQVFSWKILILLDVESSLMREIVLNFFNIIS